MMRKSSGVALVSALIFMFIVVIFLSIVVTNSVNSQRNATDSLRTSQAQFAAEAGLDDAVATLWHRLWGSIPPEQRSLTRYATELAKAPLNLGAEGATYRSSVSTLSSGSTYSYEITRLADVKANEALEAVVLRVKAMGVLPDGRTTRVLQSDFTVRRGFFPFEFALLTNQAECVFCHADIKSLDALAGPPNPDDPKTWWDRTKVGVLNSLIMRGNQHAGTVSGSILTRGDVYQQDGDPGVSDLLYTNMTVGQDKISQATTSPINSDINYRADCEPESFETDPTDCWVKRALYLDYPRGSSSSDFPDGELPNSFPLPIPDTNNNRMIDDDEWELAVDASITGTSEEYPKGTITAGMQVIVGAGSASWGGSTQTKTSDELGRLPDSSSSDGRPSNIVVLDGTSTPIHVVGTVFINGDVVIRGKVQGNGTLLARGNIYVLGDLTYDCTQTQGSAECDYKQRDKLPQFSLVAGGSVFVGDYVTVSTLRGDLDDPLAPGNVQAPFTYCKNNPPDKSRCGSNPDSLEPNFTLVQLANWNRDELWRALNDSGYTPRFYTYGEQEVYFTNNCGQNSQSYSAYKSLSDAVQNGGAVQHCKGESPVANDAKLITETLPENVQGAIKIDLNPKSLSPDGIKTLWAESARTRPDDALRTDGLLYSGNAVFSLIRRDTVTAGQWDLRGALIAPDTGILTPGPCGEAETNTTCSYNGKVRDNYGLRIYHDNRLRPRIAQDQKLGLFRSQWRVVPR